jgi:hypothetical protein
MTIDFEKIKIGYIKLTFIVRHMIYAPPPLQVMILSSKIGKYLIPSTPIALYEHAYTSIKDKLIYDVASQ